MDNNKCPQCTAEIKNPVLYQCARCFTKYCIECPGTNGGRNCPKCRMSARLLLPMDVSQK